MSYAKIQAISGHNGHVKTACRYAVQDDKSTLELHPDAENAPKLHLASTRHLSGPETAAEEFAMTKQFFGKTGGRQAYQLIQSFSPENKNLTPETAHEIGVQLASELFSDHEAVIGTHIDRNHIHNHIILNSVSLRDGHKIHLRNGWIENVLWEASNRISREHGVQILAGRGRDAVRTPLKERRFRPGSHKETLRRDMYYAVRHSAGRDEMLNILQMYGYEIDPGGRHVKVRPPHSDRFFRLDRIYTEDECAYLRGENPGSMKRRMKTLRKAEGTEVPEAGRVSIWQLSFLCYLQMLSEQEKKRRRDIPADEYRQLPDRIRQFQFVCANDIRSGKEVKAALKEARKKLRDASHERYLLTREDSRLQPLTEAVKHIRCFRGRPDLQPFEQEMLCSAEKTLSDADTDTDAVLAAKADLDERLTACTDRRRECYEQVRLLQNLKSGLRQIQAGVKLRLRETEERKIRSKATQETQVYSPGTVRSGPSGRAVSAARTEGRNRYER